MKIGTTAKAAASGLGFLGGPIGGLLGNVVGGLFGRSGQSAANRANLKIARENREWQERMSNTAYSRAAKDLDAAGLNRILALGSPASTPAGNIATMQNEEAPLGEGIKTGTALALTAKKINAEVANIRAQTALTRARTNAIAPAETLGEIVIKAKERLSGVSDWQSMKDQAGRDWNSAKEYFRRQGAQGAQARANTRQRIADAVRGFNISGHNAERTLLGVVRQMDLPPMSDAEALEWAVNNQDKIKQFLERQ